MADLCRHLPRIDGVFLGPCITSTCEGNYKREGEGELELGGWERDFAEAWTDRETCVVLQHQDVLTRCTDNGKVHE